MGEKEKAAETAAFSFLINNLAERKGFEPLCQVSLTIRFRVGAVMTTSVPLRKPAIVSQLMSLLKRLFLLFATLAVSACGDWLTPGGPLSFPTPGRDDLVVLTALPLAAADNEPTGVSGLERDLVEAFAQELGVPVKYRPASNAELPDKLAGSRYHIALGWFSAGDDANLQASVPIFTSRDVLIQHEGSLPLTSRTQLAHKTVHVMAGSRQARTMHQLAGPEHIANGCDGRFTDIGLG